MGGGDELEAGALITPTLRLERRIGGGGMGAVWLAHHEGLDTKVVVKFIAQDLEGNEVSAARFRREAAAAASVKSPHVVQMLDYGLTEKGRPFIAMELLVGRDLGEHLREHRVVPPHEVVEIIRQVCKALQRAHDMGVVHRDIKPENIFLCDHGDGEIFVKLLDFGIARSDDKSLTLTTTGAAVGTPHYMSPEQAIGSKTLDHRTDIWSLGVLTYFLCTGRRPFAGETTGALTLAIFNGPIPKPSEANPSLPKAFDRWFAKACSRDADARFPSARVLASELSDALLAEAHRAIVDVDAISFRPEPGSDPRSAATVKVQGAVPTTPDDDVAPARTTAGVATGVSQQVVAVPVKSRTPLAVGVFVATIVLGLGGYQLTRSQPAAPAPSAPAAPASTPAPVETVPPPPAVTAPPPPSASTSVAPVASSVAAPVRPFKIAAPKPSAAPTSTIKLTDDTPLK